MATTHVRERKEPVTPSGDVDAVIAALADVDLEESATEDEDDGVLPELDVAFDELAESVDAPEPIDAAAAGADDGRTVDERLRREEPDFETVAENTDVDSIPYENAAAFLANTLYSVPPANTRFEFVEPDALTPDWELDGAF